MLDSFKSRLLLLPLVVVALDQWSKLWIEQSLGLYERISVIPGFLSITKVANTGIAFGLFQSGRAFVATAVLVGLGLLALVVVSVYFWRAPSSQRLLLVALALIMGGAVGNLIDRILFRAVTDFVELSVRDWSWPTFNVADSAISIGIVLLAWETLTARPAEAEVDLPEASPSPSGSSGPSAGAVAGGS